MRRVFSLLLASALTLGLLASCNTTGGGAMTGAMFGGVIGSSIGGISGGWRGSDIGTLVGMAVGAGTGAAIGSAAEAKERESIREHYRSLGIDSDNPNTVADDDDDVYGVSKSKDKSGYSATPKYDDRIDFDGNGSVASGGDVPPAVVEISETGAVVSTPVTIENARFINGDNTMHISKGELVKISFEVRNVSGESVYGLVPTVKETTGNKHLLISPATMIENLGSHKAIRYTAYISAERSLKKGTAHFQIVIMSADKQLSNVVEFDVELN